MTTQQLDKIAQAELCDLVLNGYRLVSYVKCLNMYLLRHLTNGQTMSVTRDQHHVIVRRNAEIVKIV